MARIGIFSGTFDPVHHGHLAFCAAARQACSLEKVVLLPEAQPRGKQSVTSLAHRVAMLQLAIAGIQHLEVLKLPGARFDVKHTLPQLKREFAGHNLVLLVGSDVVRTFTYRWPHLDILLQNMELAVGLRDGDDQRVLETLLHELQATYPDTLIRYQFVSASPFAHGTSSRVRTTSGQVNETIRDVAAYIDRHQLYGSPLELA